MPEVAPVTVILVSRNRSKQLGVVLPAFACNSVMPSEILLVDDFSSDDTVEVFEGLCGSLGLPGRALPQGEGRTLFRINSMRNIGVRASRTERVIILDADHVPAPGHIAAHMRMLDRGERVISTGPRLEAANADGTGPVNFMWGHEPYSCMSSSPGSPLPFWGLVPGSNFGAHVSFLREVGLFDTEYDGAYGYDDADFNCRAAKQGALYLGDFAAHVIHLPHDTISSMRYDGRNVALFRKKNGQDLVYPSFVGLVTHRENWAKRFAAFSAGQTVSSAHRTLCSLPSPAPGEPCMALTRWAAAHAGGRFLIKLAFEKLVARVSRLWRRP